MRLGPFLRRHAVDVFVVCLSALWILETGPTVTVAVAALLGTLPLLLRRRFPFAAPALVFAGLAGVSLADSKAATDGEILTAWALVSLALAFWFAGAQERGEQAIACTAIGLASVATVAWSAGRELAVTDADPDLGVIGLVLLAGSLSLAAFALQQRARGAVQLEERATRLERQREERARAAVAAERARIAHDLHDVIAHSVSVMTVQAGAARLLLQEDLRSASEPLLSVEETGREALAEMRRLLGLLRADETDAELVSEPTTSTLEPPAGVPGGDGVDAKRFRSLLGRRLLDALLVLLVVVAEIKVWVVPGDGPRAVFIVGSLLWTLPLLLRHRLPFAAPVFAFAVQVGVAFADPTLGAETTSFVALLLTFWVVGAHNERAQAAAGAMIGFASTAVLVRVDERLGLEEAVWVSIFGGVICLIAYAFQRRARSAAELRERAALFEREREARTRAAVQAERRRIARELHDVVAHSVSVMTVQATAAQVMLTEEPEHALEPVLAVEDTGRRALAEMRRLFGILSREEGEAPLAPQPRLAQLDSLLEQARLAGLPVEFTIEGEPVALSPGIDLAAYRIVQESLTNALKHAGPARAHVSLRYGREAVELVVANDGRAAANGHGGHGLVGMRERAILYGGEFESGPRPGGGYEVRARLPVRAAER